MFSRKIRLVDIRSGSIHWISIRFDAVFNNPYNTFVNEIGGDINNVVCTGTSVYTGFEPATPDNARDNSLNL